MDKSEADPASSTDPSAHVAVDCFGERGMAHCPDHPHRMPIAAGLFGMPRPCPPRPSNDGGGFGRMMTAA